LEWCCFESSTSWWSMIWDFSHFFLFFSHFAITFGMASLFPFVYTMLCLFFGNFLVFFWVVMLLEVVYIMPCFCLGVSYDATFYGPIATNVYNDLFKSLLTCIVCKLWQASLHWFFYILLVVHSLFDFHLQVFIVIVQRMLNQWWHALKWSSLQIRTNNKFSLKRRRKLKKYF